MRIKECEDCGAMYQDDECDGFCEGCRSESIGLCDECRQRREEECLTIRNSIDDGELL